MPAHEASWDIIQCDVLPKAREIVASTWLSGLVYGLTACAVLPPAQLDLDDDCLLTIFQFLAPLPDVISISKACRVRRWTQLPRMIPLQN